MEDLFGPDDWRNDPDPVVYITRRYLAGLERLILADPSQYLWAHPRWGEDYLRTATEAASHQTDRGR